MAKPINQRPSGGMRQMFREYGETLVWLLRDSTWRYKGKVVAMLVAAFIGASLKGLALGQALYYANLLKKDKVFRVLGWEFRPRESLLLLAAFAVGVFLALLISAAMVYYARAGAVTLGITYEWLCSKRILTRLGRSLRVWSPEPEGLITDRLMLRIAMTDARYCGRILRIMLYGITPGLTFAIFFGILLYIDPLATVIVGLFVGASVLVLYRINRLSARSSRAFERTNIEARVERRRIIQYLRGMSHVDEDLAWLDGPFNDGPIVDNREAYRKRLTVVEYSRLMGTALTAVIVAAVIVYLGGRALATGTGWGLLIGYLYSLKQCTTNLTHVSRVFTSVNRFYPQLKRYRGFLVNSGTRRAEGAPDRLPKGIEAGEGSLEGSETAWRIETGRRLGLVSPAPSNRYNLAFILDCLLSPEDDQLDEVLSATCFASADFGAPPVGLRSFLGLGPDDDWGTVRSMLSAAGFEDTGDRWLADHMDEPVPRETWQGLPRPLRYGLALETIRRAECPWVMLHEPSLRALPEQVRSHYLEAFADRAVLIVYGTDVQQAGAYREDTMAVIGRDHVIGIGSPEWLRGHSEEVAVRLSAIARDLGIGADEDEDEDEEEAAFDE